jgi:glucose-1-phosphate adenylyltransferase
MDPNLVILAGGISSRMRRPGSAPVDPSLLREAEQRPKSMIGVGAGRRPLLDYLLFNAREAGYRDIVIVIGERDREFREQYGPADRNNTFRGLTISYALQPIPAGRSKPLGTADALLCALRTREDWRGKAFTVCNSDNLYSRRALRLLLEDPHPAALIDYDRHALRFEQSRIEQFAVIWKKPSGFLEAIVEKPTPAAIAAAADASGRVGVSMNIFRFSFDRVFPLLDRVPLHPVRQEQEIPTAVMMMVAVDQESVMTIPLSEYVPDLTHQDDIAEVQRYLHATYPDFAF